MYTFSVRPRRESGGASAFPWIDKSGYNLTTDMADEAISFMNSLNAAAPEKPFFVYYVPGGTHSPHQPKKEWIEKFKGKFDMGRNCASRSSPTRSGSAWSQRAQLTPWPDTLPKWDSHSLIQKKLYAREAEVFAGYAAYTDNEISRVIQAVEHMGKLDNTLIDAWDMKDPYVASNNYYDLNRPGPRRFPRRRCIIPSHASLLS